MEEGDVWNITNFGLWPIRSEDRESMHEEVRHTSAIGTVRREFKRKAPNPNLTASGAAIHSITG